MKERREINGGIVEWKAARGRRGSKLHRFDSDRIEEEEGNDRSEFKESLKKLYLGLKEVLVEDVEARTLRLMDWKRRST